MHEKTVLSLKSKLTVIQWSFVDGRHSSIFSNKTTFKEIQLCDVSTMLSLRMDAFDNNYMVNGTYNFRHARKLWYFNVNAFGDFDTKQKQIQFLCDELNHEGV